MTCILMSVYENLDDSADGPDDNLLGISAPECNDKAVRLVHCFESIGRECAHPRNHDGVHFHSSSSSSRGSTRLR